MSDDINKDAKLRKAVNVLSGLGSNLFSMKEMKEIINGSTAMGMRLSDMKFRIFSNMVIVKYYQAFFYYLTKNADKTKQTAYDAFVTLAEYNLFRKKYPVQKANELDSTEKYWYSHIDNGTIRQIFNILADAILKNWSSKIDFNGNGRFDEYAFDFKTMKDPNSAICYFGDCSNGLGMIIWPSGNMYIGESDNQVYDGYGLQIFDDYTEICEYKNDKKNGYCAFIFSSDYKGQYKAFKMFTATYENNQFEKAYIVIKR